eukprot:CAMPEP_0184752642 /NCGR_PEP_ID=MMETSP0315-20130426/43687_1 /TAXON_ID=101924 /ORGANISM="Rhodosorus marinus, Strain UTEX LB 2760" /LENGTH=291 /DNA_ID=CAMNT_0027231985 /DNA_START=153 /DNA_END=1028 /DNA_ORIENTATION=-
MTDAYPVENNAELTAEKKSTLEAQISSASDLTVQTSQNSSLTRSSGGTMKVGNKHQAALPKRRYFTKEARESVRIDSERVWDPMRTSKNIVDEYKSKCDELHLQNFGEEMPPKVYQAAMMCLRRHEYSVDKALKEFEVGDLAAAMRMTEKHPFVPFAIIPGENKTFDFVGIAEEQEKEFAQLLLYLGKDLSSIGESISADAPEIIVRYYYQRYKQVSYLRGEKQRDSKLVEYSSVPPNEQAMDAKRVIAALRVLALSSHDSFEVDKRVVKAVSFFRNKRTWVKLIKKAQGK